MLSRLTYGQGFARNAAQSAFPELWRGLIGSWSPPLGPTGLALRDWSGNQNDGALTNMDNDDWVVGQRGYALNCDGTNHYVDCGDIEAVEGISSISVSVWIRFDVPLTTDNMLVTKDAGGSDRSWQLAHLGNSGPGDGTIRMVVFTAGAVFADSSVAIADTGWHFCVATYDGATILVYVDGQVGTGAAQTGNIKNTTNSVLIGERTDGFGTLDGKVGDVFIHNRVLESQEIAAICAGASPLVRKKDIPLSISGFNIQNFLSLMQGDRL